MIGVIAEVESYRIAVAELPLSASLAAGPVGAVVVVAGGGRWDQCVRTAAGAGAAAVIVVRPVALAAELIDRLVVAVGALPVVVERPFLRQDTVVDACDARAGDGMPPAVVTVDAVAAASTFDVVLRDAVGWMRVLSGGTPVPGAAGGGLALFEASGADGAPAVLTAVRVPAGSDRIRAHALGEARVEIDASATGDAVSTTTIFGRTTAPRRHESHQRLTLRRAIEAAVSGTAVTDLADLASDAEISATIARSIRGS